MESFALDLHEYALGFARWRGWVLGTDNLSNSDLSGIHCYSNFGILKKAKMICQIMIAMEKASKKQQSTSIIVL